MIRAYDWLWKIRNREPDWASFHRQQNLKQGSSHDWLKAIVCKKKDASPLAPIMSIEATDKNSCVRLPIFEAKITIFLWDDIALRCRWAFGFVSPTCAWEQLRIGETKSATKHLQTWTRLTMQKKKRRNLMRSKCLDWFHPRNPICNKTSWAQENGLILIYNITLHAQKYISYNKFDDIKKVFASEWRLALEPSIVTINSLSQKFVRNDRMSGP